MPFIQVIILWIALACDIASKVSVTVQTWRFIDNHHYWWAAFILLFFVLSSIVSACYWATHYPGGIADQAVQMPALQPVEGSPSQLCWTAAAAPHAPHHKCKHVCKPLGFRRRLMGQPHACM